MERELTTVRDAVRRLEGLYAEYASPGPPAAVARQHARNKLTVHERLDLLLDPGAPRFEVATFAARGCYGEHGEIRSAGVRVVIGSVSGRLSLVVANDSMVKSGTWFPLTIKKILRAQEIALENRLPVIYLVDSGGLFLPLQDGSFPDRDHAGRIFYSNARLSAAGVPQIAAVMGPCVAGGAYIPALCDELLIVKGTGGVFLAAPHLVKAAIGEVSEIEELGGADTHAEWSGMADYVDGGEEECLARVRRLAGTWPEPPATRYPVHPPADPESAPDALLSLLPAERTEAYEMRALLRSIIDADSWEEYKARYGRSLLTGTARLNGRVVGIVASQRSVSRTARGEMHIGGVIYGDAAAKAARFVVNCNQKGIPLLFFQDVTGFMIGKRAEQGGIIREGAKLVNAVANSRVPKITVVVGNSYGAGNYALCGRAYGPRFLLAWPTASIAVMAGDHAAETMLAIEKSKAGASVTEEEEAGILARVRRRYERTLSPYHAAANLWVDAVIDPRRTRETLDLLLAVACRHDPEEEFRLGVFQV